MKPFTNKSECEKCGNEDVHVRWRKYGAGWNFATGNYDPEDLECICRKCSYEWSMETKGSQND